jgi:hypothetical protein
MLDLDIWVFDIQQSKLNQHRETLAYRLTCTVEIVHDVSLADPLV